MPVGFLERRNILTWRHDPSDHRPRTTLRVTRSCLYFLTPRRAMVRLSEHAALARVLARQLGGRRQRLAPFIVLGTVRCIAVPQRRVQEQLLPGNDQGPNDQSPGLVSAETKEGRITATERNGGGWSGSTTVCDTARLVPTSRQPSPGETERHTTGAGALTKWQRGWRSCSRHATSPPSSCRHGRHVRHDSDAIT